MICFGSPRHRRIGRHWYSKIGRATVYGRRTLHIVSCIHCDKIKVLG